MGLILEGEEFAVLSDILGDEDHFGDMDFKVAGPQMESPPSRWTSRSAACRRRSWPMFLIRPGRVDFISWEG